MNRLISTPASHLRHLHLRGAPKPKLISSEQFDISVLWRYKILDPNSDIVTRWNYIFQVVCLISLFVDPLYFFRPYVGGPACMSTDDATSLRITYFRTLCDLFYLLHILFKFRTAFVAPTSRVFGKGELVMDAQAIATRYLQSDFIIDFAAFLPLPQAGSLFLFFSELIAN